jgi:hypothetical protein
MIRSTLFGAALCLLALPTLADPRALGTEDIRALLTGNTVHGTWAGKDYFSYFGPDGSTTYVVPGQPATRGRWQAHGDRYCSRWSEVGAETCYALEMDGDTLLWVTSEGVRYPSKVLVGEQLPK